MELPLFRDRIPSQCSNSASRKIICSFSLQGVRSSLEPIYPKPTSITKKFALSKRIFSFFCLGVQMWGKIDDVFATMKSLS